MSKYNGKRKKRVSGGDSLIARIQYRVHPELKELIDRESVTKGIPRNDLMSEILAAYFGRPELGFVPRKTLIGRPLAIASKMQHD
jgi:hypothetical protein